MGLWPVAASRQAPDVRAGGRMSEASQGAGCPELGPDVRVEVAKLLVRSVVDAGFPGRCRMSGLWRGAGCLGLAPDVRPLMLLAVCWCSSLAAAQAPDVRPLDRMSGRCSFSSSVFFRRRFQASLADGVVVPWRSHSSSTSVKLRQYLCMHTGEVSSSIPSSKGSS